MADEPYQSLIRRRRHLYGSESDIDRDVHSVSSIDEDINVPRTAPFTLDSTMSSPTRGRPSDAFQTVPFERQNGVVEARFQWQSQLEASAGNKFVTSQESDILLKQFERPPDERRQRSFRAGYPMAEERAVEGAPMLHIGLTLLKGADKPQVTRLEQHGMVKDNVPHQKDANWRFNTARTLLADFDVGHDLSYIHTDRTADIAKIARRRQRQRLIGGTDDRQGASQRNNRLILTAAIGVDDVVTIDSNAVRIVNDLRSGEWDIQSTLIEVDEASLVHLIINFRHLVSIGGPNMTFAEHRAVLEKMIEDARRLCIRSPILFRMSTRQHIINSKNTRYGIDHDDDKFKTLTTSSGIKQIISLGASYFNSLDPSTSSDKEQQMIRPKFLQMIVLLLMLLNNDDLEEIRDFLEATYKLKATRSHLEMVFLKVIPLMSINPRVFMEALVRTVDGRDPHQPGSLIPNERMDTALACWWDVFTKLRLQEGYFLPGGIDNLGRSARSWSPQWPNEGFKSSLIFDHLQYANPNCKLRAINDIAPIDLHPEASMQAVSVALTDGSIVTIHPDDMDNITLLSSGKYAVNDASPDGNERTYDLVIKDNIINEEIKHSLMELNGLIDRHNKLLESPRGTSFLRKFFGSDPKQLPYLERLRPASEITQCVAIGGPKNALLASTYKSNARKIVRFDVISIMARDIQRTYEAIQVLDKRSSAVLGPDERQKLSQKLEAIQMALVAADKTRKTVCDAQQLSDDPIARIIYPGSWNPREKGVWFEYKAYFTEHDQLMTVEGKAAFITEVVWSSSNTAQIRLDGHLGVYTVKPLREVDASEQVDQARVDDYAVLAGQYILIATPAGPNRSGREDFLMENCLQIIGFQAQGQSRRGANRAQDSSGMTRISFR